MPSPVGVHREDGLLCKSLQLPSDLEILDLLFIVKKATENNKVQAASLFSLGAVPQVKQTRFLF